MKRTHFTWPSFLMVRALLGCTLLVTTLAPRVHCESPARTAKKSPSPAPKAGKEMTAGVIAGVPAIRQTLNVSYFEGKGRSSRHVLDIFAPRKVRTAKPVVLFVHGGSWMFGNKNLFGLNRGVGKFLARQGYVAVLINYRLSPWVSHPAHVKDVARAFAWTRKHIAKYGGDRDQIVLCGHSAGGHLVSLLGTDARYLKDPLLKLTRTDRTALRAIIAVCGIYRIPTPGEFKGMVRDVLPMPGNLAKSDADSVAGLIRQSNAINPFALVFGTNKERLRQASPISHVRKGLPPFLLLYAEAEIPRVPEMTRNFARALRNRENVTQVKKIPGCSHNTILFRLNRRSDPTGQALLKFLEQHTSKKDG